MKTYRFAGTKKEKRTKIQFQLSLIHGSNKLARQFHMKKPHIVGSNYRSTRMPLIDYTRRFVRNVFTYYLCILFRNYISNPNTKCERMLTLGCNCFLLQFCRWTCGFCTFWLFSMSLLSNMYIVKAIFVQSTGFECFGGNFWCVRLLNPLNALEEIGAAMNPRLDIKKTTRSLEVIFNRNLI